MPEGPTVGLPARQLFALPDAGAVRILCTAGCLWLTLDDDLRDVVLHPGDSFESPDSRRALIYAFEPSAFVLLAQAPASASRVPARSGAERKRPPVVWAATRAAGSC